MQGRQFLDLAREVVQGTTEAHWRGGVIHAYYAVLLEGRDALIQWGRPAPPRQNVHPHVRLTFQYASDRDLQLIASTLDELVRARNHASYDLNPLSTFASNAKAVDLVRQAEGALALLDTILADPARESSAKASLPPPP